MRKYLALKLRALASWLDPDPAIETLANYDFVLMPEGTSEAMPEVIAALCGWRKTGVV